MEWRVNATPLVALLLGMIRYRCKEAGWAVGTVWTCTKNLASTVIRSPDRPARGGSLY